MRIIFFVFFLLVMNFWTALSARNTPWIPIAEKIIDDSGKELAKEFNMVLIGTGGAMYDCVHTLDLSFYVYRPLNRSEVRKLAVECANKFLKNINSSKAIRPYLETYPFTTENIELSIFVFDEEGYKVYDPLIGVVSVYKGKISYRTESPDLQYTYKDKFDESFADAQHIVQKESKSPKPAQHNDSQSLFEETQGQDGGEENELSVYNFLPMNYRPYTPLLNLAIPNDFVVESVISGQKPKLLDGVIWGTQEALTSLEINQSLPLNPQDSSVFYVGFFEQMQQIGPNTFSLEKTLKESLEKGGWENVAINKTSWGEYPVLSATGLCRGKPIVVAWMGLNREGHVLVFQYYFSQNKSHWDEEKQLWERFINETRPVKHVP